jgi:hypothetical protein
MKYIPGFRFSIRSQIRQPLIKTLRTLQRKPTNVDHILPELEPNTEYEIYQITPKIEKGITTSVTYAFRGRGKITKIVFNNVGDAETKIDKILGVIPGQQKEQDSLARENIKRDLGAAAAKYFNR